MKIQDYIHVLRRRGWIILLSIVVTAASALVFSRLQTPVYRASIEVSIQLARPDLSLTQSAKQLLRSYANVMLSEKRAAMVIQTLGLFMDPRDLKGDVKIVADDSIMAIKIDVDNPDGEIANQIANAWPSWCSGAMNRTHDRTVRIASLPRSSTRSFLPRLLRPKSANVAAGAMLGLVLGTVLVLVLECLKPASSTTPTL